MKKAFQEITDSLKAKQAKVKREFERTIDKKAQITGQRYTKDEAEKQIVKALAMLNKFYNYEPP